ncbi:hypothetical protein DMENIID0001_151250 [Sergentomyia squamirostris]
MDDVCRSSVVRFAPTSSHLYMKHVHLRKDMRSIEKKVGIIRSTDNSQGGSSLDSPSHSLLTDVVDK